MIVEYGILTSVQVQHFITETKSAADQPGASQALRVVIAYQDIVAGKRAMAVLTDLAKSFGEDLEFEPIPWSFDLLASHDWREVAASDAVKADILIIATSSNHPLPPAVEQWAEAAINQKEGTAAAVVALLGPEDGFSATGSSRFATIKAATRRAGLDYFTPAPRHEIDEAIAGIHARAETVTPVLEKILHQPDAVPPLGT